LDFTASRFHRCFQQAAAIRLPVLSTGVRRLKNMALAKADGLPLKEYYAADRGADMATTRFHKIYHYQNHD
jgi:hypothetical protein